MEPVDFNKAPQGATHFLRYDSGYVVWCCVIEDGPNGLPIVKEWDSFNEYWVPAIHGADYYYSIGMQWIDAPAPAPQAPAQPEAPKGATHRYDHAGSTAWYREVDGKLFVWRDGSWHAGAYKNIPELAASCMLGKLTSLVEDKGGPAEDDLTWLARNVDRKLALPDVTHISRAKRRGHVFGIFPHGAHPSAEPNWFTKAQWLARRAELQNKPSWADAPEWAQWLAQDESGFWYWYALRPTHPGMKSWWPEPATENNQCGKGEVLGDWRDTLERRPEKSRAELEVELVNVVEAVLRPDDSFLSPANSHFKLRAAFSVMRANPDRCDTEAVDAVYKLSRELLIQRDALPGDLSSKALVAASAIQLLRNEPHMFSANELADLHQLCDAELTKRDAAVCGGQKYLDAHWFERGELPPVGAKCLVKMWDRNWATMTIKGYHENTVWAGTNLCSLDKAEFRPFHPNHDSLREVLEQHTLLPEKIGPLTDAILAAGFKRGEA